MCTVYALMDWVVGVSYVHTACSGRMIDGMLGRRWDRNVGGEGKGRGAVWCAKQIDWVWGWERKRSTYHLPHNLQYILVKCQCTALCTYTLLVKSTKTLKGR